MLAVISSYPLLGQSGAQTSAGQEPEFTIRADTRVVLTDVVVTDRDGNPVRGLKSSDFEILDNRNQQDIGSFEEHIEQGVAELPKGSDGKGSFNNDYMLHLPPVLNVMVIDIKNIEIEDQMYLYHELNQFIEKLPAGEPLAIYWCRGANTVLLQPFTADHALLAAAVHKALPRFPPTGREFSSDFTTLQQIALDLGDIPGRKNILWFTGGSTLYLRQDGAMSAPYVDEAKVRAVYDQLETSRIAIYPVDARGLMVMGAGLLSNSALLAQHTQMSQVAEATGGHAYYNNNGLDGIAAHVLNSGGEFYSLSYSPKNFKEDNKWHKVEIKLVDNKAGHEASYGAGYQLSYRRGYFADDSGGQKKSSLSAANQKGNQGLRRLLGGGTVAGVDAQMGDAPIIFQVKLLPAAEAAAMSEKADVVVPADQAKVDSKQGRGTIPYALRYSLPLDDFAVRTIDGKPQVMLGLALIVFNQNGTVAARVGKKVNMAIRPEKLPLKPGMQVSIEEQVNLPKGDDSVYCAVWDMTGHRMGTIRVPLEVMKKVAASKP